MFNLSQQAVADITKKFSSKLFSILELGMKEHKSLKKLINNNNIIDQVVIMSSPLISAIFSTV